MNKSNIECKAVYGCTPQASSLMDYKIHMEEED